MKVMYSYYVKDKELSPKEKSARKQTRNKFLACFIFAIVLYIFYSFCLPQININSLNIIIYIISILGIEIAMLDILKKGVKIYNVFTAVYFLFLAINNLNISGLQSEKTWSDVYYLVFGALVFALTLWFFDQIKIKQHIKARQTINPNTIAKFIFVIAVMLKLLVFMQTGIRLVNAVDWASETGSKYAVSGLSGLAEIAIWLSLMFVPHVKNKMKIVISVSAIFLFGVLSISRNNIMMMIIFLIMCYAQSEGNRLMINKKTTRRLALASIIVAIGFTVLGNYRQMMLGWSDPGQVIANLLQSKVSNSTINWIYSYTAINFDVMVQIMAKSEHPYTIYSIGAPFVRFVAGNNSLMNFYDAVYHIGGLNGFNASTFLGPMIYELGQFYIIGAFLLGLQVGFFSYIARSERSKGHYAYLMAFSALSIFGNFYSLPICCYTSIAACITFPFVGPNNEKHRLR